MINAADDTQQHDKKEFFFFYQCDSSSHDAVKSQTDEPNAAETFKINN